MNAYWKVGYSCIRLNLGTRRGRGDLHPPVLPPGKEPPTPIEWGGWMGPTGHIKKFLVPAGNGITIPRGVQPSHYTN